MTKQELIAKYNPANAQNLTEDDVLALRALTNDDLKVLAEAYPNAAQRKPYLVLHDNNLPANRQLRNLSTWRNLYNVRAMSNQKNLIPWTFRELWDAERVRQNPKRASRLAAKTAPKPVQVDLSADEAANLLRGAMKKVDADAKPAAVANPPKPVKAEVKPVAPKATSKDLAGKTTRAKPAATTKMQAKTVDLAQTPGGNVAPAADTPEDQQEQDFS